MSEQAEYFARYLPDNFCRDYVEINGSSVQLTMFMSLVLGLKPLMDDWVAGSRLAAYRAMCERYGIFLKVESAFLSVKKEQLGDRVKGGEQLTSTVAFGFPAQVAETGPCQELFSRLGRSPNYHVFLSQERALLNSGLWYPLIIRDRVQWPPYADVLSYGEVLGYPACCVNYFRLRNDWNSYNFLAQINQRSLGQPAHYFCNPLTKDRTYSYIYHMPCSWHCAGTKALVQRLRAGIMEREPRLVKEIDRHLLLPALVFYERKHYVFDGTLEGNQLQYKHVYYPDAAPDGVEYFRILQRGDELELTGEPENTVRVYKAGKPVGEIKAKSTGFAPEQPFLIQFSEPGE